MGTEEVKLKYRWGIMDSYMRAVAVVLHFQQRQDPRNNGMEGKERRAYFIRKGISLNGEYAPFL